MALWQRPARAGLASFALTLAATLLYNMSDRGGPPAASPVVPVDPTAVLESHGARITRGDGSEIVAERQFAYDDGSVRLVGVEVIVPPGDDRDDFRIRSGEATGVEQAGDWRLADSVVIRTGDGLSGTTAEATYAESTGVVTMPKPARFEQGWMRLEGEAARYDRRRGLLYLDRRAVVELRSGTDGDTRLTRIASGRAEIDRLAGMLRFAQGAVIDAGGRRMQADAVVVRFDPDESLIEAIDLTGDASVLGREAAGTDLREMTAQAIVVTYREGEVDRATLTGEARLQGADDGPGRLRGLSAPAVEVSYRDGAPERATMTGGARVELFGERPGTAGLSIEGASIVLALEGGAAGIDELRAKERVRLAFPEEAGSLRRIRARALDIRDAAERPGAAAGRSGAQAEARESLTAVFDGDVEMRESEVGPAAPERADRVMRADRLRAELAAGLVRLTDTRFIGNVALEAEGISARADRARYAPEDALFTLVTPDATAAAPRMDDERGFVQAQRISIDLDGPDVEAIRAVKGVLNGAEADSASTVRPGLFTEGDPIHFVAGRFAYDSAQSLATYDRVARLWQGSTEFRGNRIVIDETTGDVTAEGRVRTRTTMLQQDAEQEGAVEETATTGSGQTLFYDNRQRQARYSTGATLTTPRSTLSGGTIELFLHEDARTLERIEAVGKVALDLETRSVTAATLRYDDREGRYDLTGEPVSVIERMTGQCRETTGRSVTFHTTDDSISADGQAAERTASASGGCGPGTDSQRGSTPASWRSSRPSR